MKNRHPRYDSKRSVAVGLVLLSAAVLTCSSQGALAAPQTGSPGDEAASPATSVAEGTDQPVVTAYAGEDGDEPLSVQWRDGATVPPGATRVVVDASVVPSRDGAHRFTLGGGGTAEVDGRPTVGSVPLTAGTPVQVRATWDDPDEGAHVTLEASVDGAPAQVAATSAPSIAEAGDQVRAGISCGSPSTGDRDHDLVPDAWEESGYTVVDGALVPWRDEYAALGHREYRSDPNSCRTARDPYTDREKAFGVLPGGTRREARDPLVAAAPAVGVDLEALHVTPNDTTSDTTSRTKSFETTHAWSRTLGGKLGAEAGAGKEAGGPPSGSVKASGEFSLSYTRTHSVTEGTATTWQETVTRSRSKAASLNGNVRYHNAGTAPVFDAHPTTSWVLQGGHTMASFRAGPNFRADALGAGERYPSPQSPPLSVETVNDAGTSDLTIDAEEVAALGAQGEVTLDTPQTSGTYGRLVDGHLDAGAGAWGPVLVGVREASATLVLDAGPEVAERHVVAPDLRDPDDRTPRLTLGEALERAFDLERIDGHLHYRSPDAADASHRTPVLLDEQAVLLTMDLATKAAFDEQLADGRAPYEVELRRGMHLGVQPAIDFQDFSTQPFPGWSDYDTSVTGHVRPRDVPSSPPRWTKGDLVPGHRYRVAFSSAEGSAGLAPVEVGSRGVVLGRVVPPGGHRWARLALEFTAIGTEATLSGRNHYDDVALFDLGAVKRADVAWATRPGDDLAVVDTTEELSLPVDFLGATGQTELDLIVRRDGHPLDLADGKVLVDGSAVGPWATGAEYKARGHVNLPLAGQGVATVTVLDRRDDLPDCEDCFTPVAIVPLEVTASRPATVTFYYRQGESRAMCTMRYRTLEVPGLQGEVASSVNFTSNGHGCRNDDAYYLSYRNMPPGVELSVYDSPDGSRNDDFFTWETRDRDSSGLLRLDPREKPVGVTVQEQSYRNGLLGKVSRFEIRYPGTW